MRIAGSMPPLETSYRAELVGEDTAILATYREMASVLASEVDWAVLVEGAATLEDVVYRRVRTAVYVPEIADTSVERIAARMAELLGWDDERRRAEVDRVRLRLRDDLAFRDAS